MLLINIAQEEAARFDNELLETGEGNKYKNATL